MTTVVDRFEATKQLPSNVNSKEQLVHLPEEYLSNDASRPLLFVDTTRTTKPTIIEDNESTSNGMDEGTTIGYAEEVESEQKQPKFMQFKYALRPLWYSVIFILLIECLERLSYYGINNTETGTYNQLGAVRYQSHVNSIIPKPNVIPPSSCFSFFSLLQYFRKLF